MNSSACAADRSASSPGQFTANTMAMVGEISRPVAARLGDGAGGLSGTRSDCARAPGRS